MLNLYLYDEKHEKVFGELPDIKHGTEVKKVVDFLEQKGILDRYRKVVLAEKYEMGSIEGEPVVIFFGEI
jgi:hypothetical protein